MVSLALFSHEPVVVKTNNNNNNNNNKNNNNDDDDVLIPLTLILRKSKAGYELGKGYVTVIQLMFMDDL